MLLPNTEFRFSLRRPDAETGRRAALVALVAALLTAPEATAAARPGVAVTGFRVTGANAELQRRLAKAVEGGLQAAGGEIVPAPAHTDAILVLRGTVEARHRKLSVRLEMLDAATNQVVATKADRCDACSPDEAQESVSLTASALLADALRATAHLSPTTGEPQPPTPPPPPIAPDVPADEAGLASPPAAPEPIAAPIAPASAPGTELAPAPAGHSDQPRRRTLAWAGAIGGLALAGAGVAMIVLDGRCATEPPAGAGCQDLWNTRWPGIALTVVGGGLAATGTLWLYGHRNRGGIALVPGPGTLQLAGRF